MNRFLLITIISFNILQATPGCIEMSYHLTKKYDDKTYHPVIETIDNETMCCPCPCKYVSIRRGECLECGHARYFRPFYIVTGKEILKTRRMCYQPNQTDTNSQLERLDSLQPKQHQITNIIAAEVKEITLPRIAH